MVKVNSITAAQIISHATICRNLQFARYFSKLSAIDHLNLSAQKIALIRPGSQHASIPLHANWEPASPIKVILSSANPDPNAQTHYYCGGLPAQMQAVRKVEQLKNTTQKVHYVNDGKIAKSLQSGHQAHVHPSEWTATDCHFPNLTKTLLRELSLLPKLQPDDVENYSYLHFPLSRQAFFEHPLQLLSIYGSFAAYALAHAFTAKKGISQRDRWLCNCVTESLKYHQRLSDTIKAQQGVPTFERGYRIYWSPNSKGMLKKKETWEELGIHCEPLTKQELLSKTLLKPTRLTAFKVMGDGKFFPETPSRITEYCKRNFPSQFITRSAVVTELHIHKATKRPIYVRERLPNGTLEDIPIRSFFCSPGHNQVHHHSTQKPLWEEVPVSGVSTIWKWEIDKKEFFERIGRELSDTELKHHFLELVASANLSNLHVTSWDCEVSQNKIHADIRISQGGNFNSHVAEKNDLLNMKANIEQFFIGNWTPVSIGTCTRKTNVTNVPEYLPLSENPNHPVGFLHSLSGIGYSFSATPFEMLSQKPPL